MTLEHLVTELRRLETRVAAVVDAHDVGDAEGLSDLLLLLSEDVDALLEAVEREAIDG
jgi:hypothetical protein